MHLYLQGCMGITHFHPWFFRLVKKILNFCLPTLTPGTLVTCLEGRSWVESPRSPWGLRATRVCCSLPFLESPAPTYSNSFTAAGWTVWSWRRRRGTACWRRPSELSSWTFRWGAVTVKQSKEIWKQRHLSEDSFTIQVNPSSSWWMFLSLFLQVFDDLQKMVRISESQLQSPATYSKSVKTLQVPGTIINTSPLLRMVLGLFVALATVSMGIYAF